MNNVPEFIAQLKMWGKRETGEQKATIADLRRGLQEFPQLAPHMHRYIAPFTADLRNTAVWEKQTYYLVAALFAHYHSGSKEPAYAKYGNMGSHFAELVQANPDGSDSIQRRFEILLTAHPQDLHYYLRQTIAFLHGQTDTTIPINWEGIFWDIRHWGNDDKRPQVQEKWAAAFWGGKAKAEKSEKEAITN